VITLFDQFRRHESACRAAFDLSLPQTAVLLSLDVPLSQSELADRLQYDASNITAIVDGLERRGLVKRQVDREDRRIRRLFLTRQGNRAVAQLRESLLDECPLFDALDDDEQIALHGLLAKATGDSGKTAWVEMFLRRK
jgi:DNA-binding MarR family transcriptional regulator